MTANDIIASALRRLKVLASGEVPTAAEAADALTVLNDMIDEWNAQRLFIFGIVRQVFNLVSNKQVYTMGTGGDFNIPRPPKIELVGVIALNNPLQPLELPMDYITDQKWAGIPVKNIPSPLPSECWDDQGFPLRNLTLWPVPSVANQIAFYIWNQLGQFADLVTDYTFPPAYAKAIKNNFAVDLAAEFGVEPPAVVVELATEGKAIVKRMNIQPVFLSCDRAVAAGEGGYYNILTDE